ATENHPFRTLNGWKNLGDLRPGVRIAAPRRLPVPTPHTWPRHEIITLAGLLAEGNTCHPTCLYFFGNDPVIVQDFADAVAGFRAPVAGTATGDDGAVEVCASAGRDGGSGKGRVPGNAPQKPPGAPLGAGQAPPPIRSGAFRWAEAL